MRYFFFQAEDGIRDGHVTGVQTCALPISFAVRRDVAPDCERIFWRRSSAISSPFPPAALRYATPPPAAVPVPVLARIRPLQQIGRASCRERVLVGVGAVGLRGC